MNNVRNLILRKEKRKTIPCIQYNSKNASYFSFSKVLFVLIDVLSDLCVKKQKIGYLLYLWSTIKGPRTILNVLSTASLFDWLLNNTAWCITNALPDHSRNLFSSKTVIAQNSACVFDWNWPLRPFTICYGEKTRS